MLRLASWGLEFRVTSHFRPDSTASAFVFSRAPDSRFLGPGARWAGSAFNLEFGAKMLTAATLNRTEMQKRGEEVLQRRLAKVLSKSPHLPPLRKEAGVGAASRSYSP